MTKVIEQVKTQEIEQGKEKRNVPKLRFKGFEDEWEEKKIEDVSDVIMGQSPSSEYYNEEMIGMPLIQGNADIKDRITSPRMYTTSITKTCNIGDIIMSVRAPVGSIVKSMHIACIGRGVCSIVPKINNEYLYQILLIQENRWCKLSQGSTFDSINRSDIGRLKIYIPCLNEQIKIAKFLGIIDKKIEKQSEKVEALKTYKKGIMQKIFKQEIRFKDENGEEYPEWEEKKINEMFIVTRGEIIAKTAISDKKTEIFKYPVYSSQTTNKGILGYDVKFDFSGEYLTWTTDGANAGKVFKRKGEFRCTNVCGLLVEKAETKGFANNCIKEILDKATPRHVSYVGNPKLMNNIMNNISINIPCLSEQSKIAEFLTTIDEKIEKEEKKLDELKVWKKGLLQKMFV